MHLPTRQRKRFRLIRTSVMVIGILATSAPRQEMSGTLFKRTYKATSLQLACGLELVVVHVLGVQVVVAATLHALKAEKTRTRQLAQCPIPLALATPISPVSH